MSRNFEGESRNQELNVRFDEWEKKCDDKVGIFVRDGIVNEKFYDDSKRILFLLKERNLNDEQMKKVPTPHQRDMRLSLREGSWSVLGQWAYGLQETTVDSVPRFKRAKENHKSAVKSVAVMNLKKIAGKEKSDLEQIKQVAKDHEKSIREELNIIKPKIVICGGTFSVCQAILGEFKVSERVERAYTSSEFTNSLWLDFMHPSFRGIYHEIPYYALTSIYQRAIRE